MSENKKYLYYYQRYGNELFRVVVSKESDSNYWYKLVNRASEAYENKISKKTMREGSGYDAVRYYEETPELLQKYKAAYLKRMYRKKLEKLKTCTDAGVMTAVLSIKIPEDSEDV